MNIQRVEVHSSAFRRSGIIAFLLAGWLILAFCVRPVFAKEFKIQYGNLEIIPKIDYGLSYSNNIYADKANKQSDFIHTLTPSFSLKKKIGYHNSISAGYSIGFVAYNDFGENNSQDHSLSLSSELKFPAANLSLGINDNYARTSDLLGTDNQYNVGKKTKRWNNSADFTLGYDFGDRYKLELTYDNIMLRFDDNDDKWQNRFDHKYGLYIFYKLTGKTSVFASYQQTLAEHDEQNNGVSGWSDSTSQDHTVNDYSVGIRLKPIGRLHGELSFGYDTQKFNNDVSKDGTPYNDDSSWVAGATVNYEMINKTDISYTFQRSYKSSPDSDASSYLDTSMGLSLSSSFAKHMSAGISINWSHVNYSGEKPGLPDKSFNTYSAGINYEWRIIEWFTAGVGYEYEKKCASDGAYEDEEHEINSLFFTFDFDLDF